MKLKAIFFTVIVMFSRQCFSSPFAMGNLGNTRINFYGSLLYYPSPYGFVYSNMQLATTTLAVTTSAPFGSTCASPKIEIVASLMRNVVNDGTSSSTPAWWLWDNSSWTVISAGNPYTMALNRTYYVFAYAYVTANSSWNFN